MTTSIYNENNNTWTTSVLTITRTTTDQEIYDATDNVELQKQLFDCREYCQLVHEQDQMLERFNIWQPIIKEKL